MKIYRRNGTITNTDIEFKIMAIRMLKDLRGRIDYLSENLNKEIVSIKKHTENIHKNLKK